MSVPHSPLVDAIAGDFASRHVRSPRVFLPCKRGDWESLVFPGVLASDPTSAPDVIIHDQERNWLFLFDAVRSGRVMDDLRRDQLSALFAPCGRELIIFAAFADRNSFSRSAKAIPWETHVWIADEPQHMIHFDDRGFLGPYANAGTKGEARLKRFRNPHH